MLASTAIDSIHIGLLTLCSAAAAAVALPARTGPESADLDTYEGFNPALAKGCMTKLHGYSDASWETKHSTSGWVVLWKSAALAFLFARVSGEFHFPSCRLSRVVYTRDVAVEIGVSNDQRGEGG